MRMTTRTSPSEILERLALTLNYSQGERISIHELSNRVDLSWATTRKYVQTLEELSRVMPQISLDANGAAVTEMGRNLTELREQEDIQLLLYLLIHARISGSPTEPISRETHSRTLDKYEETAQSLEDLDLIHRDEETVRLKPEGVSMAAPVLSKILSTDPSEGLHSSKAIVRPSNTLSHFSEGNMSSGWSSSPKPGSFGIKSKGSDYQPGGDHTYVSS